MCLQHDWVLTFQTWHSNNMVKQATQSRQCVVACCSRGEICNASSSRGWTSSRDIRSGNISVKKRKRWRLNPNTENINSQCPHVWWPSTANMVETKNYLHILHKGRKATNGHKCQKSSNVGHASCPPLQIISGNVKCQIFVVCCRYANVHKVVPSKEPNTNTLWGSQSSTVQRAKE